jgi:excisionase family DNA binding protein
LNNLPEPKLLTVKQVAALLNKSTRSIWRMADAGTLPSVKVDGSTRWKRSVVERFIERLQ